MRQFLELHLVLVVPTLLQRHFFLSMWRVGMVGLSVARSGGSWVVGIFWSWVLDWRRFPSEIGR